MTTYNFVLPLKQEEINKLKIKDLVYLSGTIYTARDVAHQKLFQLIQNNQPLPFELKNNIIYYTGPSPALPGMIIGSAGPTTSKRMDKFTPRLYDLGLKITIGKGEDYKKFLNLLKEIKDCIWQQLVELEYYCIIALLNVKLLLLKN